MSAEPGQPLFVRGELAAAAFGIALFLSTFMLKWYGVDGVPGHSRAVVSTVDAWNGLTLLPWLMLALSALTVASVVLHMSQRLHGARTDTSLLVAAVGTVTAAALLWRVLIDPPEAHAIVDQKIGALVGLGCAIGVAVCGWTWFLELRRRRPPVIHRPRRRSAPQRPA